MNNSQFRKLLIDTPARQNSEGKEINDGTSRRDGATPSALGSRMRSSIPMTPRSVATAGGIDFARQLAERNNEGKPVKKFRSTAVPKGAKLAAGYIDRTKERVDDEQDDKATRVKALEEMMKLQQIDAATFEKLRDEIIGGDVGSVHLVKGLDYKLLERVRRGEDVLSGDSSSNEVAESSAVDVDGEFDALEKQEITPTVKETNVKKGEMAPPALLPSKKRTRDSILAEMKAARDAAKAKTAPALGAKFRKVGAEQVGPRFERDSKGREVMVVIDADGNEKRKVRKVQQGGSALLMPDIDAKPLGMEVPEYVKPVAEQEEEEDNDIFDDVGDDYDPLAGIDENDSADEETEAAPDDVRAENAESGLESGKDVTAMAPPPRPQDTAPSRNYFGNKKSKEEEELARNSAVSNEEMLAILKKAATLHAPSEVSKEEKERAEKRKRMLQSDDRDAQDMDMGFGSSRFADEEDSEEKRVKMSNWGDKNDRDDEDGEGHGKGKRKRGPKKRKGDGNNIADVMRVLERRKAT